MAMPVERHRSPLGNLIAPLAGLGRRLEKREPARGYIVSFPKSGRTWLRAQLAHVLATRAGLDPRGHHELEALCRANGLTPTQFSHNGTQYSHPKPASDRRVASPKQWFGCHNILLVREPRDTLVSAYFQATQRLGNYDGPISDFIRDERFGIHKILSAYRRWNRNFRWARSTLVLHYETLHSEPAQALAAAVKQLGAAEPSQAELEAAIGFGRFDNMRQMETQGTAAQPGLGGGKGDAPTEALKTRRGKVGGYTDYLSAADLAYIDAVERHMGNPFPPPSKVTA